MAELVGAAAVGNYAAATSRPPLPEAAAAAASAPFFFFFFFFVVVLFFSPPSLHHPAAMGSYARELARATRVVSSNLLKGDSLKGGVEVAKDTLKE